MKTFEQWVETQKTAFLSENPAPQSKDFPHRIDLFEDTVGTWERSLGIRMSIWNSQKEAWSACAAEYEHTLRNKEAALKLKSEAFEILKKKNAELEKSLEESRGLIVRIANDRSPPWDRTDFQILCREYCEANSGEAP